MFFSHGGTPNIASVIPVMDHLNEHLAMAAVSQKYDPAIRAAVTIRKKTLNQYYDQLDHSDLYRIAMGTCACIFMSKTQGANSFYF